MIPDECQHCGQMICLLCLFCTHRPICGSVERTVDEKGNEQISLANWTAEQKLGLAERLIRAAGRDLKPATT